jgi:CubicO group peptidase (beta-lactamase class C family)
MRSRLQLLSAALLLTAACSSGGDASSATTGDGPESTDTKGSIVEEPDLAPETAPSAIESVTTESVVTETLATPDTEPTPNYDFSALGPIVADFVTERQLAGAGLIVVEREAGVVHEEYWGGFDADRISLIASSSKMISAGVLLHLDDEGILDIDAPVSEVAEWGAANPTITPAQLISNSSGLVGLLPDPTYAPYLCQYIATGTLQECAESIFTTPADDADVIPPDTEFRYGGAQWTVAGAVAEVASGKSWAELVDETFAEPCGLESLAFNNHFAQIGAGFDYPVEFNGDPTTLVATTNPNPEGGAYITVPDYGELMLMHLRGGQCGDVQVLSPEAVDRLHADRIGPAYDGQASADGSGGAGTGYGMGWWVDRTTGRINDGGAYGTVPWLDLEDGYGVYLLVESSAGTGSELAELLYDPIETAITAS